MGGGVAEAWVNLKPRGAQGKPEVERGNPRRALVREFGDTGWGSSLVREFGDTGGEVR